jgi:hypothetical protein
MHGIAFIVIASSEVAPLKVHREILHCCASWMNCQAVSNFVALSGKVDLHMLKF